jgi:hypothetical protein
MNFREIAERYQLQKMLRSSRGSNVMLAAESATGRPVAIKLIRLGASGDYAGDARRFEALAAALAELQHPALPAVLDFGLTPDGSGFVVFERIEGSPLESLAGAASGQPERILALLVQALDGLEAMARRGLAHHNLSTDNLLVTNAPPGERIKILGLASAPFRPALSAPPETARFLAPEQTQPGVKADSRADVYSLALVACRALGATVAPGSSPSVQMPFALSLALDNDEVLRQALERALRESPAERPSFRDLRDAFRLAVGAAAPAPVPAKPPAPPEPVAPMAPMAPIAPIAPIAPPEAPAAVLSSPAAEPSGEELLPAISDEMLDEMLAAAAPPPPPPAPEEETAAAPARRPLALWLAVAAAVLVAIALGIWLLRRPAETVAAAAAPVAPEPPQKTPSERLEEARLYVAIGEDDLARQTLRTVSFADQAALGPAGCDRMRILQETLALSALEKLPDDLARGLRTGNLALLRGSVAAGEDLGAAFPEVARADFDRARSLVGLYDQATDDARNGRNAEVLARFAELERLTAGLTDPLELRRNAAQALETEAEGLAREAHYAEAVARLDPVAKSWPDRAGLSARIASYRAAQTEEPRQVALLANLSRFRKPDEALTALAAVEPTPHLKPRFDEARQRLQAQLGQLDKTPPQVALRDGFLLEYDRGNVVELSFRVTDDYQVKSVKLMARPQGGKMRELPLERSRQGYYTVEIPPSFHQNGTVELYVVASDLSGHEGSLGSRDQPLQVKRRQSERITG